MRKNPNEFSFLEHLDELRNRLIKCLIVFVVGSCVAYQFVEHILAFIIQPVGQVVFTDPAEAFLARFTFALWTGFFLTLPFILYQLWKFVGLALTVKERRWIFLFGPLSLLFFIVGSLFGFVVILPVGMNFLLGFASETMVPMISVSKYLSFVGMIVLAFGIIFELPLVMVFLAKIGIATPAFLSEKRKYVIVFIFIVSALLTPPDIISQILLALPLIILYEIGIIFIRLTHHGSE